METSGFEISEHLGPISFSQNPFEGSGKSAIPTFCIISFVVMICLTILVSTLVVIYFIRKRRQEMKQLE